MSAPTILLAPGVVKPRWRGRLHYWAGWVSAVLAVVLVGRIAGSPLERLGAGVYGGAFIALFALSAAHHRRLGTERARPWIRWADHAAIYIAIAATYTPICLLALEPGTRRRMLAVVWALAALGAACKLGLRQRFRRIGGLLYVGLGWFAVVALPDLARALPPAAVGCMVAGGLLYSAGALVLLRRRPDPRPAVFGYHEVWHAFVVVAAACHYGMVAIALAAH